LIVACVYNFNTIYKNYQAYALNIYEHQSINVNECCRWYYILLKKLPLKFIAA